MKQEIMFFLKFILTVFVSVLLSKNAIALDKTLDVDDLPLVLQGAKPKANVMLLMDDSGSMRSEDVFYSPGFNFHHDYACSDDSAYVANDSPIVAKIYKDFDGLAAFEYRGSDFVLMQGAGASYSDTKVIETVNARCRSTSSTIYYHNGSWNTSSRSRSSYGFANADGSRCDDTGYRTGPRDELEALCRIDISGTTGSCQVSAVDPVWAGASGRFYEPSNGYDYMAASLALNNVTLQSTRTVSKSFSGRCFDPGLTYQIQLRANNCSVDSDGLSVCTAASSATETYSGQYLNWYFSDSSDDWFDYDQVFDAAILRLEEFVGGLTVNLDAPAKNFITTGVGSGYRSNTSLDHQRMQTAKDVAAIFIAGAQDLEIGVASYDNGVGGEIDREILELGNLNYTGASGTENKLDVNRRQLLNQIDELRDGGSTPIAESLASIALYYTHGMNRSDTDNYVLGIATDTLFNSGTVEVNYRDLFSSFNSWRVPDVTAASVATLEPPMSSDQFCQQNFIIALTDGEPTNDCNVHAKLKDTDGDNDSTSCSSQSDYMDDVAKALRDNDLRPDINDFAGDPYLNFITTYVIGFSDAVTRPASAVYALLSETANNGGGAFYPADDGVALASAFEDIQNSITEDASSITTVAVSNAASLRESNWAIQTSYDLTYWSGNLNAYFINGDGEFEDKLVDFSTTPHRIIDNFIPGVGVATGSTTNNMQPVWQSGDVLNRMYLIQGDTTENEEFEFYRDLNDPVNGRKIYTLNNSRDGGVEFLFSNFGLFSDPLKADIDVGVIRFNSSRPELINYLRGDISNEIGNPILQSSGGIGKFRQRVNASAATVNINGTNQFVITAVQQETSILGDITHSDPILVGMPALAWGVDNTVSSQGVPAFGGLPWSEDDYNYFAANHAGLEKRTNALGEVEFIYHEDRARVPVAYVGANDGMLHAFTTQPFVDGGENIYSFGSEIFAYMPSFLASSERTEGIHFLADPNYGGEEHRYHVNIVPTQSDVFMDLYYSGGSPEHEWRSVLVSGVGGGGRGVFALDVTCPFVNSYESNALEDRTGTTVENTCRDESFNADNVLWEFSSQHHADLGLTYSQPIIAKVNYITDDYGRDCMDNDDPNGNCQGRWAALVNNGYNSPDGRAVLYVLFLDGGRDGTWVEGEDFLVLYASEQGIDTPSIDDNSSNKNGLSSPQGIAAPNGFHLLPSEDTRARGMLTHVYAGDLKGNVWVWDISNPLTQADYDSNRMSDVWTVDKFFEVEQTDILTTQQAITTAPQLGRSKSAVCPNRSNGIDIECYAVMFGTGEYIEKVDLTSLKLNTVYGVLEDYDRNSVSFDYPISIDQSIVDSNGDSVDLLGQVSFLESIIPGTDGRQSTRRLTDFLINGFQRGWYINLVGTDSPTTSDYLGERMIYDGYVAINDPLFLFTTLIPDTRECSGGSSGWTIGLNWTTGQAFGQNPYDRYLEARLFDTNNDGTIDDSDETGVVGKSSTSTPAKPSPISIPGGGPATIQTCANDEICIQEMGFLTRLFAARLTWEEKQAYGLKK